MSEHLRWSIWGVIRTHTRKKNLKHTYLCICNYISRYIKTHLTFFFSFLYKNGIYCLKSGNAVNIENVLPLKTIVPIVFDDCALDDPLKYDNNDNER